MEMRQWNVNQTEDPEVEMIMANLEADPSMSDKYVVEDGLLYYLDPHLPINLRKRLFVPQRQRRAFLRLRHDDPVYGGHLGIKKTKTKLIELYWPKMATDIENYVRTCETCQKYKTPKGPKYGMMQSIITSDICARIHIDIAGPYPMTQDGNRYIVTAIDAFSRYGFARAFPEVKAKQITQFLTEEIFLKHGPPE